MKIEGRMKQPEYTAAVTGIYRKYLDILKENRASYKVDEKDRKFLLDAFNRGGSCQGYYKQHNGPDMIAFHNHKKTSVTSVKTFSVKKKIRGNLILYPESPATSPGFLRVSRSCCLHGRSAVCKGTSHGRSKDPAADGKAWKYRVCLEDLNIQMQRSDFYSGKDIK